MTNINQQKFKSYLSQSLRLTPNDYWFVIRQDIFAIPYLDGFLLYSPLQGLILMITRAGLGELLLNPSKSISDSITNCIIKDDTSIISDFDLRPFQTPHCNEQNINALTFKPTSLALSLTSSCQLACSYCYINGGDTNRNMAWDLVEEAILNTINNLVETGGNIFIVEFHGQGEPTYNWDLFTRSVLFINSKCKELNVIPQMSIVTNGILTKEKVDFIAFNNIKVGLSFDGLKHTMDRQRPLRNGKSSFDRVVSTIKMFTENNVDIAIRATITNLNIDEMIEFIEFVSQNTKIKYMNFEPVCGVGRATKNKRITSRVVSSFAEKFQEAREFGLSKDILITYSATRIDGIRSSFCGAYGENLNFCISTEGIVSSCYEVLDESDPRAEIFIYGKYDFANKKFLFDESRLNRLLSMNVTKFPRCRDCFAKWSCGGDCLSKASLKGIKNIMSDNDNDRCYINRFLLPDELIRCFINKKKDGDNAYINECTM